MSEASITNTNVQVVPYHFTESNYTPAFFKSVTDTSAHILFQFSALVLSDGLYQIEIPFTVNDPATPAATQVYARSAAALKAYHTVTGANRTIFAAGGVQIAIHNKGSAYTQFESGKIVSAPFQLYTGEYLTDSVASGTGFTFRTNSVTATGFVFGPGWLVKV